MSLTALASAPARAQTPFSSCLDGTGNIFNATVLLPAESTPEVNGIPLAPGSEIAVFASEAGYPDLCVGILRWQQQATYMAVWGDDFLTPWRDGLMPGEALRYRVWDSRTNVEYGSSSVQVSYSQGTGEYSDNAVLIVSRLAVESVSVGSETMGEDPGETAQLLGNYPNPVREETTISFLLPVAMPVTLEVFDLLGKRQATLVTGTLAAGQHQVRWDAREVPSGVYFCHLRTEDALSTRRLLIVR